MERIHPLKNLLQLHLASDASAVSHLPFILSALTPQVFSPSSHLPKWTARLNSLLHSKDPGPRWAGICIALETSRMSQEIMLEFGQGWVTVVLPILSRNEEICVWKATIRLIIFIFTATWSIPVFQRQVVTPNVPKFSLALVTLIQKQRDMDIKLLSMDALNVLVPMYPSLHRALHPSIASISLQTLQGHYPLSTPSVVVERAARLHACLHTTGGKVGSANLWRKNVDETVAFCFSTFAALRTTFPHNGQDAVSSCSDDPIVTISLNLERLSCGIRLLCELLQSPTSRPVPVPVSTLVSLAVGLLKCTFDEMETDQIDRNIRASEEAVIPSILKFACDLLTCLAKCIRHRISPYLSRLLSFVTFHLEQKYPIAQRLPFVRLIPVLLGACHLPHDPLIAGRLVKAILPTLSIFFISESEARKERLYSDSDAGRKGKKRARAYEGDEVFKLGKEIICSGDDEGEIVMATLVALPALLRTPNLASYLHSISSRVLLSLLLSVPQISVSSLSSNHNLRDNILRQVKRVCVELSIGTSPVMSNSLALVVSPLTVNIEDDLSVSTHQNIVDLLLHPRLPPLLRSLPPLEVIAFTRADESKEEKSARDSLGLVAMNVDQPMLEPAVERRNDHVVTAPPITEAIDLVPHSAALMQPGSSDLVVAQNSPAYYISPHTRPAPAFPSAPSPGFPSVSVTRLSNQPIGVASQAQPFSPIAADASAALTVENDDDEEMPSINMESDSESE